MPGISLEYSGGQQTLCWKAHSVTVDPSGCANAYKGRTQAYVAASYLLVFIVL